MGRVSERVGRRRGVQGGELSRESGNGILVVTALEVISSKIISNTASATWPEGISTVMLLDGTECSHSFLHENWPEHLVSLFAMHQP